MGVRVCYERCSVIQKQSSVDQKKGRSGADMEQERGTHQGVSDGPRMVAHQTNLRQGRARGFDAQGLGALPRH